jgi:hypothetical protein
MAETRGFSRILPFLPGRKKIAAFCIRLEEINHIISLQAHFSTIEGLF